MPRGDGLASSGGYLMGEKIVPPAPGFLFDVSGSEWRRKHMHGQSKPKGHRPNKLFVAIRLGAPQPMIDMEHSNGQTEFPQGMQEKHRIRAARNGHTDAPIPVAFDTIHHVNTSIVGRPILAAAVLSGGFPFPRATTDTWIASSRSTSAVPPPAPCCSTSVAGKSTTSARKSSIAPIPPPTAAGKSIPPS